MIGKLKIGAIAGGLSVLLWTASCGGNTTKQASSTTVGNSTSSAPSGQAASNKNVALVRFINGVPDEKLTLAFNGTPVFSDVKYQDVAPYKELPADGKNFGLFPAGSNNNAPPLASSDSGISSGNHYTVVAALDEQGGRKLDVITDNLAQPPNGKADVRVINASAQKVDITAPEARKSDNGKHHQGKGAFNNKADKWFSGVSAADSKGYKDVDPVNGTIDVEKDTSSSGGSSEMGGGNTPKKVNPVLQLPVNFEAGKLYTIVVTGGTQKFPLKATTMEDQLSGSAPANQNQ